MTMKNEPGAICKCKLHVCLMLFGFYRMLIDICLMFSIFILYPTLMATVQPPKRRRTGHRPPPMVEGSGASLDTAMYIHSEGGEKILVPV